MFRTLARVLLAKIESTYGTDSVPVVGTDALDASNVKVREVPDILERDVVRGDLSPIAPVVGQKKMEITFSTELKGSGALGTAPAIGDLFQACGYAETVSAGSSVVYLPTSSAMKGVTIYVYDNQDTGNTLLRKLVGCRGTFRLQAEAGKFAKIEWTFTGFYTAPSDVSAPSAATYESTIPAVVESAAFTLNSNTSLVVQQLTIEQNNQVEDRDDISGTNSGLKEIIITGRKPGGTFNPEQVLVATYDFYADWAASTARALSVIVGTVAGNKITITAPKVTIDSFDDDNRNGILTKNVPFRMSRNSGNDELRFSFA